MSPCSNRSEDGLCEQGLCSQVVCTIIRERRRCTRAVCSMHLCMRPVLALDRPIIIILKFSATLAADNAMPFGCEHVCKECGEHGQYVSTLNPFTTDSVKALHFAILV